MDKSPILSDSCECPEPDFDEWIQNYGCTSGKTSYAQIDDDLKIFHDKSVDISESFEKAKKKFSPGSSSFCHYAVLENGSKTKNAFFSLN